MHEAATDGQQGGQTKYAVQRCALLMAHVALDA
jgi:hypothetical protein